ncbi:hypothetical protein CSA56_03140 [candidate division KSB3 bacterium]|uniref:Uncharacterized protein n=1 Tax=candidate division KSB3 bacterium TaxID=2044937 RepID=A0A2G6KJ80_9BACT|nr:MAG: hypothetical protein CSA56_03140 [candidate division KSB3 bacterium]
MKAIEGTSSTGSRQAVKEIALKRAKNIQKGKSKSARKSNSCVNEIVLLHAVVDGVVESTGLSMTSASARQAQNGGRRAGELHRPVTLTLSKPEFTDEFFTHIPQRHENTRLG